MFLEQHFQTLAQSHLYPIICAHTRSLSLQLPRGQNDSFLGILHREEWAVCWKRVSERKRQGLRS
jgi:hypothetical protein